MLIRRIVPLTMLALVAFSTPFVANEVAPTQERHFNVADGWPPPTDCGLYDICRSVTPDATKIAETPVFIADGWPPPTDCGLYDICRSDNRNEAESTLVADGWPPPTDCGLYDICRGSASSEKVPAAEKGSITVADGWPPPTDCGLYDICRVSS